MLSSCLLALALASAEPDVPRSGLHGVPLVRGAEPDVPRSGLHGVPLVRGAEPDVPRSGLHGVPLVPRAEPASHRLTMQEAIRLALHAEPAVAEASIGLQRSELGVLRARL